MILSPSSPVSPLVARLHIAVSAIAVSFPERNDAFREVIKGLGYTWDGNKRLWQRAINETNGPAIDRLAEVGSNLLKIGFIVNASPETAELIQAGNWRPEIKRWVIVAGEQFGLRWRGHDDGLWTRSHFLPGAQYDSITKSVTIPALYFSEVEGFAAEHDFCFTQSAQALLSRARRDYARILLPEIPTPTQPKTASKHQRYCDPAKFADIPAHHLTTTTELYSYQAVAVDKLIPLRLGALFMDMGTGKTRCAIELVTRRQARTSKVIWFCPVSLKLTIAAEIAKHTNGEAIFVFDNATSDSNIPVAFWYVVGIESMSSSDRVVMTVNRLIDADTFVIVDESSYIKGPASKRSMRITELSKNARYRLLLTGTPISQGIEDLYSQMRFLHPDILGYNSFYSFAKHHLEYSEKYPGLVVKAHGVSLLADKITPYIYQVTKEECLSLPPKLYDQFYCSLTESQQDAYNQAKEDILQDADELDSITIFRLFTVLQQIVSGFWNRQGELMEFPHHRMEASQTALSGIPANEKVIIWCKYIYSLEHIKAILGDCASYYGGLSEQERSVQLDRFRGDIRYLVATQATGGHGLTLNEARYHIFYENEFKYSHRVQAEDRSHRIGQNSPVTYIDIYSHSGIDQRIQAALEKKEDVVKAFRNEVKKRKGIIDL